jgi:hypothetical protein
LDIEIIVVYSKRGRGFFAAAGRASGGFAATTGGGFGDDCSRATGAATGGFTVGAAAFTGAAARRLRSIKSISFCHCFS